MQLIYLGEELNSALEHDLHSDNEHGFKVTVHYAKNSHICQHEGYPFVEIRNNCTQVHNLFRGIEDDIIGDPKRSRIAFESDLHWTGGWKYTQELEKVVIELADKMEDEY